jgi:uncharacterized protein (TIGR03435 family)
MTGELVNHLWQSTVFAMVAGLLTLEFRRNRAHVRYWLWFCASVKFLVPFALLLSLGSYLGRSTAAKTIPLLASTYRVVQVAEPFPVSTLPIPSPQRNIDWIGIVLVSLWACGFAGIVLTRLRGWFRIRLAVRASTPMDIPFPVPVCFTTALMEPGVVGFFRPMLLLPAGIVERLAPSQLQAILAHELCHVRRRDNLTAAIHMLVEALFWFHPLVWRISARLIADRERACDEAVLELGSDPQVYAESILKTCQFCVESPLACMSGVTGANLKKRIVGIMAERVGHKLDLRGKLLLFAAGLMAVVIPIVLGMANSPESSSSPQSEVTIATLPRFEVVSIKSFESDPMGRSYGFSIANPPDEASFLATDVTLQKLIEEAYGVRYSRLLMRVPAWLNAERFDVQAKADSAASNELKALSRDQEVVVKRQMLQALLLDRFKLTAHRETKTLPVYALVVAKSGSRLQESKPTEGGSNNSEGPDGLPVLEAGCFGIQHTLPGQWNVTGHAVSTKDLAEILMGIDTVDRPVLDQTGPRGNHNVLARLLVDLHLMHRRAVDEEGLKGRYDINLQWRSDPGQAANSEKDNSVKLEPVNTSARESSELSIFAAIQKQLGLKLESTKHPVEVLVIDHVERPSEN